MTLNQIKQIITIAECGSMNEASKRLFLSQPSLSSAVKELEEELGITIFVRSNRGIVLTKDGERFLSYARQVYEQFELLESYYQDDSKQKKYFSVSMQHYTFAVEAFMNVVKQFGMDEFEFSIYECRTSEVIDNVAEGKSEIGVLYLDDFNEKVLNKICKEHNLEFQSLFDCDVYVYLSKEHPLANHKEIAFDELLEYPCCHFDQGMNNSFYYAEEVLSTRDYPKLIQVNDRASILNMMVGLNAYTLCSGIICEELNGEDYKAIKLKENQIMRIGYIKKRGLPLSKIAKQYIEELSSYKDKVL